MNLANYVRFIVWLCTFFKLASRVIRKPDPGAIFGTRPAKTRFDYHKRRSNLHVFVIFQVSNKKDMNNFKFALAWWVKERCKSIIVEFFFFFLLSFFFLNNASQTKFSWRCVNSEKSAEHTFRRQNYCKSNWMEDTHADQKQKGLHQSEQNGHKCELTTALTIRLTITVKKIDYR